jgi:hypothetical protein
MNDVLCVHARFCGPPGCANGGYVAGMLARSHDGPLSVTFRKPVRLDAPVRVEQKAGDLRVWDGDDLVVDAVAATLDLEPVHRPTFAQAEAAAHHYVALDDHPFPRCFVCGTAREHGDGLRIFAGPVEGMHCVASPWTPDASVADRDGTVPREIVTAALDCPGCFGAYLDISPRPAVLGRFTSRVTGAIHVDEPCVVIGWPIGHDGRKHHVGSALLDSKGQICGVARATWIEVPAHFAGP